MKTFLPLLFIVYCSIMWLGYHLFSSLLMGHLLLVQNAIMKNLGVYTCHLFSLCITLGEVLRYAYFCLMGALIHWFILSISDIWTSTDTTISDPCSYCSLNRWQHSHRGSAYTFSTSLTLRGSPTKYYLGLKK